jgi:hypothetical protein
MPDAEVFVHDNLGILELLELSPCNAFGVYGLEL